MLSQLLFTLMINLVLCDNYQQQYNPSSVQEFRIPYSSKPNKEINVFLNKPLNIVLEEYYKYYNIEVKCSTSRLYDINFEPNYINSDLIMKIPRVTTEMNDTWTCSVPLYDSNWYFYFTIHVIDPDDAVVLIVNHLILPPKEDSAVYFYKKGEKLFIHCLPPKESRSNCNVQLNKQVNGYYEMQETNSIEIESDYMVGYNNIIQCKCFYTTGTFFTIKYAFMAMIDTTYDINLYINHNRLIVGTLQEKEIHLRYAYSSLESILLVECFTETRKYIVTIDPQTQTTGLQYDAQKLIFNVDLRITRELILNMVEEHSEIQKQIMIRFIHIEGIFDTNLRPPSPTNPVITSVPLTPYPSATNNFNAAKVIPLPTSSFTTIKPEIATVLPHVASTTIKSVSPKVPPKHISSTTTKPTATEVITLTSVTTINDEGYPKGEAINVGNQEVLVIVGIVVLLGLVLITICVYKKNKLNRRTHRVPTDNYDYLQNEANNPIPRYPPQWESNACLVDQNNEIYENQETLYANAETKKRNNKSENLYANNVPGGVQIDDDEGESASEITYAIIDHPSNIYANHARPKSLRHKISNQRVDLYAQVIPASKRCSGRSAGDTTGANYVNSRPNEYLEPTYSEVVKPS